MKTYKQIIEDLSNVTDMLVDGSITVEIAKQVCINTQTLINAAKLQLEVLKYKKEFESEFFKEGNTVIEPINETLKEIEEKQKERYKL